MPACCPACCAALGSPKYVPLAGPNLSVVSEACCAADLMFAGDPAAGCPSTSREGASGGLACGVGTPEGKTGVGLGNPPACGAKRPACCVNAVAGGCGYLGTYPLPGIKTIGGP